MLPSRRILVPLAFLIGLAFVSPAEPATSSRKKTGRVGRPQARTTRKPARRTVRQQPRPYVPPAVVLPPDASARDREIGEAARRGLGTTHGSVVAMDPYTGRVIAIVNPREGLSAAYQPCSVFKIVVAIAGLTEGVITPETTFDCRGGSCWMWAGHGPINLRRALAQSCNPFFEQVGERLGYARVQRYAQLLGLGTPTGINLADEASGRVPDFVSQSKVGHLSSHAAGVTTSAVQVGAMLSTAINGGTLFQPQIGTAGGFTPRERWRLPPNTVLAGLSEGFLSAVNEGSASNAFDPDVIVAGKTGTCSGVGWFASYAPADKPEVVVVVFVRPGNGHLASEVAGRVYQNLYKPQLAEGMAARALTSP
jgi:cell division protein FtsI/penicillin-binding protein 2